MARNYHGFADEVAGPHCPNSGTEFIGNTRDWTCEVEGRIHRSLGSDSQVELEKVVSHYKTEQMKTEL